MQKTNIIRPPRDALVNLKQFISNALSFSKVFDYLKILVLNKIMALRAPSGCFFVQNRFNGHVLQIASETDDVLLKPKSERMCENQLWYKDGNFIKCKQNNLALTMNPGIASIGAKLYVAGCQWTPYQKWITKKKTQIANQMEKCKLN